jgi:predicted DNA-binding transcriptional regulator YafY
MHNSYTRSLPQKGFTTAHLLAAAAACHALQPTPLQELYENSKGVAKRCAVAQAVESQWQQECTFTPDLSKPGVVQASPPEAKLSLSSSVSRLPACPFDHIGCIVSDN